MWKRLKPFFKPLLLVGNFMMLLYDISLVQNLLTNSSLQIWDVSYSVNSRDNMPNWCSTFIFFIMNIISPSLQSRFFFTISLLIKFLLHILLSFSVNVYFSDKQSVNNHPQVTLDWNVNRINPVYVTTTQLKLSESMR